MKFYLNISKAYSTIELENALQKSEPVYIVLK